MVIRLFCAAGMSTSLLVKKMEEAAKEKGKDADIAAYPFTDMERMIEGVDVALLGPQVGYQLGRAKEICNPKGVPVDVIPMQDYGMCNGMNVLKFAYKQPPIHCLHKIFKIIIREILPFFHKIMFLCMSVPAYKFCIFRSNTSKYLFTLYFFQF